MTLVELQKKYIVKASETMTIDIKKIADKMMANGFDPECVKTGNLEYWTDGIVDALEAVYELETKLTGVFKAM